MFFIVRLSWIMHLFLLVLTNDLMEGRRTDEIITNFCFFMTQNR